MKSKSPQCRGVFCDGCHALVDLPLDSSGMFKCPRCKSEQQAEPRKRVSSPEIRTDERQFRSPNRTETAQVRPQPLPSPIPSDLKGSGASSRKRRQRAAPVTDIDFGAFPEQKNDSSSPLPSDPVLSAPAGDTESKKLDQLPCVTMWQSWRTAKLRLPNYLVKGRGRQLEAIAQRFIDAITRESMPGVEVVVAGGSPNVVGANRPLRVISQISPGHFAATDVTFRAEGSDLFVRFQSLPRTLITYLRLGLYVIAFLVCYTLLMMAYLNGTGAFDSWAMDYAQKHSAEVFAGQGHHVFYKTCITDGFYTFDNTIFIAEIRASGADKLLHALVQKETGGRDAWDMATDGGQSEGLQEGTSRLQTALGYAVFQEMGVYAPAYVAQTLVSRQYTTDSYWHWWDPNAHFVIMFNDLWGTSTFLYAKDVDFKSYFPNDCGVGEEHLTAKMTAALNKSISFTASWNPVKLFAADPKLAMLSLGGPSTILAMLVGTGLYLLPMSVLHGPCGMLGWPTYEDFMNTVNARNAWVERVLSDMLMNDFGVQEHDRFSVTSQ